LKIINFKNQMRFVEHLVQEEERERKRRNYNPRGKVT
jgi:hypothetical protein